MTTNRISPRAGFCNPSALPRGPGGRCLCRQCGQEVPRGRRTFCGDACVGLWKLKTNPSYVREKLFERDHGVCRACGLDTVAINGALVELDVFNQGDHWAKVKRRPYFNDELRRLRGAMEIPAGRTSLWDADHIVEVRHGGGECGLENFQTLCLWCHRAKTAEQGKPKEEPR